MKRRDVSKIVLLDDVGCGTIRVVMVLFGNILQVLERAAVVVIGFASFIVSDTVMVQTDCHHTIVMMMRNRCVRKHTELRQNDHPQSKTGLHRCNRKRGKYTPSIVLEAGLEPAQPVKVKGF